MPWLDHTDDEVGAFHPAFREVADEALRRSNLDQDLEWAHHTHTPGNTVIPDFVLRRRDTGQWLLTFELKRSRDAVFSTRNQIQAKGYAEANHDRYRATAPCYFAIGNLEVSILFALNEGRPPRECQLHAGVFESGHFGLTPISAHKEQLVAHLRTIVERVAAGDPPVFDVVWPAILREYIQYASDPALVAVLGFGEPDTPNWTAVREFVSEAPTIEAARLLLLRCLMAEYLRGCLIRFQHPRAGIVPPTQADLNSIANTIASLQSIDFRTVFEAGVPGAYRNIGPPTREALISYIGALIDPTRRVADLAATRTDSPELVEGLLDAISPPDARDLKGKVPTDPELAALLAHLTVPDTEGTILDPCCGGGTLLSAAYDLLIGRNLGTPQVLARLRGIEADPVSARLAEIRLAFKHTAQLAPTMPVPILFGDMFANETMIFSASAILMNPPFRRYEEQDSNVVSPALRAHYQSAIAAISGTPPTTLSRQPNDHLRASLLPRRLPVS